MSTSLTFLGAARTVTGSRYLLETPGARILVDCGLFQERSHQNRNWESGRFDPATINVVLLTHGHLDHCGWLPKLVKDGFRGKVYATSATADLTPVILLDSARIQEEDAATKKARHLKEGRQSPRPIEPLYTVSDAERAIAYIRRVAHLGTAVEVAPGVSAEWGENGHILGASWVAVNVLGKRIVFSGDIGRWDRPILNDPVPPLAADYLVVESTYGDRRHEENGDIEEQMAAIVAESYSRGGNLLIPSFSVERAQELLFILAKLRRSGRLPHASVYLDSPMASKVTGIFKDHPEACDREMLSLIRQGKSPFEFDGLTFPEKASDSRRLNDIHGGAVIIAGNGMCTGGRIKHHLLHNIERPGTTLLFVGYQAPGTLGRLLLEGASEIRLFNRQLKVRAGIRTLFGMSGHADSDELLRWARVIGHPPEHCFVTHGDPEASAAFAASLRETLGWKTSNPALDDRVELV